MWDDDAMKDIWHCEEIRLEYHSTTYTIYAPNQLLLWKEGATRHTVIG